MIMTGVSAVDNNRNNSYEEESGFDLTEGDEIGTDNIMRDPTDYTDYAEKAQTRKLWKVIFIFLAVGIIGVALLFGALSIMDNEEEQKEPETEQTQNPEQTRPAEDSTNPVAELSKNAPEVEVSESKVTAKGTEFKTTDKITLNIKGSKLKETQVECKVKNATDFCLAGYAEVRDIKMNVYYLKDAAHSRIFESTENFTPQTVEGALTAGSMTVNLSGQTPVITVVAENSSGFIITLPDDSPETIDTIVTSLKIS